MFLTHSNYIRIFEMQLYCKMAKSTRGKFIGKNVAGRAGRIGPRRQIHAHGKSQTKPAADFFAARRIDPTTSARNRAAIAALLAQEKLRKSAAVFGVESCRLKVTS